MSSKTISTILNLKDNFSSTINKVTSNTKQFQRQVQQAENQAKKMRESVGNSFAGIAAKATALVGGIGLAAFAKDSLKLASDLKEVQNVVDTTFGGLSNTINDFSKTTSSQFGISELQAKKYSGTLGAMFKSAGISGTQLTDMSTQLTGLAGDMASFYNLDPDEAFAKLKSGISGMSEPLKSLGVDVSETAVESYALSQGCTTAWKAMSQGEKETWRYKTILAQTKDTQGDYAKTSTTFANSLRTMKLNFQTLGANIMAYTIPSFEKLFSRINNFVSNVNVKPTMDKLSASLAGVGQFVTELGKNMTWILPIVAGVLSGFMAFMQIAKAITVIKNISKAISDVGKLSNPVVLVAAAIGLLVAGMITAYKNSSTFRDKVDSLLVKFQGFGDFLGKTLPPLIEKVNLFFIDKLCPALKVLGDYVENVALPAIENFVQAFVDLAATVWKSIQPAVDWIVKNIVPDAWQLIASAIQDILTGATDTLNFIKDNWGLIGPIVGGITLAILEWKAALMLTEGWTKAVSAATAAWETITAVIAAIREGTTLWTAAQWLLNFALDANPIGVIIIGLSLLGVAIYEVVTHWKEIVDWISKAWEWLTKWNDTDAKDKNVSITGTHVENNPDGSVPFGALVDSDQNATGTQYWKGGPTSVNEHGDEVINLPSGSKVLTANQSKKALGNSGHVFNIYFNGNVGTEEFFDQAGEHIVNKINVALSNV